MKRVLLIAFISLSYFGFSQRFNEICASNTSVFEHDTEGFSDWIEIFNNTETALDLTGWFLTSNLEDPEMWSFPAITIEENGYFILPANANSVEEETFPYALSKSGGTYYLFNNLGGLIDSIVQPALHANNSYGLLEDEWFYFESPSPEATNELSIGFKGYANLPTVNLISGVYSKGTNVVIRSKESESIYYSLNGTNPDLGYTAPLVLKENINIKIIGTGDSLIDSRALERTYFTDVQHNLPVVSLTIDSLELFDEVTGIYMFGPEASEYYPYYGANFWGNREIHAYYEYFDTDMKLLESLDCDIKIHGGSGSRLRSMKSFQIQAKDSYEKSEFKQVYFDEKPIKNFKRLLLRNAGNDFCGTCIKDGTLHKYFIESGLDVDLLGFQPVVVYINGAYWGINNMREKVDRYYLESNYGVNPDEVNILEKGTLNPVSGEATDFIEIWDYAVDNDLSNEMHYNWVDERLDINSFIDYFIIELYANNRDWPHNNLKLWNSPEYPKWRYLCYDLDVSFRYQGTDSEDFHSLAYLLNNLAESNPHVAILDALLDNSNFKQNFVNRYADLLNTIFDEENMNEQYQEEKDSLSADMPMHYEKWCGDIFQWNERFKGVKGFLDTRVDIVREELSEVLALPPAVDIAFDVFPAGAGKVSINTIELDRCPSVYFYYPSNEITVTAEPIDNAVFEYWENTVTKERFYSSTITYDPSFGDHLLAVFKANEELFNLSLSPNPTTVDTRLNFSLPQKAEVVILVSSPDGRVISRIDKWGTLGKGTHWVNIDLNDFPKGLYFISVVTSYGMESITAQKV